MDINIGPGLQRLGAKNAVRSDGLLRFSAVSLILLFFSFPWRKARMEMGENFQRENTMADADADADLAVEK